MTDRGRPVARLTPIGREDDEHLARLIAEGRLIPARSRARWVPEPKRRLSEGSIVDVLRERRR